MTKEATKNLIVVMQAYVNGKTIQYYDVDLGYKIEHPGGPNFNDKWVDVDEDHLFRPDFYDYRIKPGSRYRSFKNVEECWREMQKHQPFGIMSSKNRKDYMSFKSLNDEGCDFCGYEGESFESAFDDIQFADGTPFGIKED